MMSRDHPPLNPRSLAAAQILGGENTSHTSYRFRSSPAGTHGEISVFLFSRPGLDSLPAEERGRRSIYVFLTSLLAGTLSISAFFLLLYLGPRPLILGALDPGAQACLESVK